MIERWFQERLSSGFYRIDVLAWCCERILILCLDYIVVAATTAPSCTAPAAPAYTPYPATYTPYPAAPAYISTPYLVTYTPYPTTYTPYLATPAYISTPYPATYTPYPA